MAAVSVRRSLVKNESPARAILQRSPATHPKLVQTLDHSRANWPLGYARLLKRRAIAVAASVDGTRKLGRPAMRTHSQRRPRGPHSQHVAAAAASSMNVS